MEIAAGAIWVLHAFLPESVLHKGSPGRMTGLETEKPSGYRHAFPFLARTVTSLSAECNYLTSIKASLLCLLWMSWREAEVRPTEKTSRVPSVQVKYGVDGSWVIQKYYEQE